VAHFKALLLFLLSLLYGYCFCQRNPTAGIVIVACHFASFQAIYEFIEQHAACVPLIGTSWRMSSAVVNVN